MSQCSQRNGLPFTSRTVWLPHPHALCCYDTFPYAPLAFEGLLRSVFRKPLSRPQFYSLCPLFKSIVQNLLASDFTGQPFLFHRKQNGRSQLPAVCCLKGNFPASLPTIFFFLKFTYRTRVRLNASPVHCTCQLYLQ